MRGLALAGGWDLSSPDERFTQLLNRCCAPLVRDMMRRFRSGHMTARLAAEDLGISRQRFYKLYKSFLAALGRRSDRQWKPGKSGGHHRPPWPPESRSLAEKLLKTHTPYSAVASEMLRRFGVKTHRATVRRFAIAHRLAPPSPRPKRRPVRRWQTQRIGQLWQYDASPHRWLPDQDWQPALLNLLDDHSRLNLAARLYPRETLLAHLDLLANAFQAHGLPLEVYVDHHSFFLAQVPEAHTQLASALHFYEVTFRFAPSAQAKGKIERSHQVWQKRLPPILRAEAIHNLPEANALLDKLRAHRNAAEPHREIRSTPQAAWDLAKKENRSALRPVPRCPWWPYVFSQKNRLTVGDDGKVAIGQQRFWVDAPPRSRVLRCLHPNGDITVLKEPPDKTKMPIVLFSNRLC